jgi:hypothetical protein
LERDVLLFLNTLINSSAELEARVEMRADMVYAGILDVFEKLKDSTDGLENGEVSDDRSLESAALSSHAQCDGPLCRASYDLEMQMQMFETVMHSDNNETLHDIRGVETLALSEPTQARWTAARSPPSPPLLRCSKLCIHSPWSSTAFLNFSLRCSTSC